MNRQVILLIVFIAIITFVVWQYFLPAFNEVSLLRQDAADWREKLASTQELSKKLSELKIKYENLSDEAEKVAQAITQGEDLPGLLVQLEDLSSRSGLVFGDVAFSSPDYKKNKQTVAAGSKTLIVDISLSGSQGSLMSFLKSIEENLRIMDVTAINFGEQEIGGYIAQNFKISLNAYYR